MCVCRLWQAVGPQRVEAGRSAQLRRQKREWVIPPIPLEENVNYTPKEFIAKIRSDKEFAKTVTYHLQGAGASKHPMHSFIVDEKTGYVRVTKVLDREEIAFYNLTGIALYTNGTEAEKRLDLRIKVLDQNDCKPTFAPVNPGAVNESSPKDTYIMKITARDDDEPGHLNSKIKYTILDQQPGGEIMFYIDSEGHLYVQNLNLDREDSYKLTIKGTDLDGAVNGNTGTGTVVVNILDINDNLPVLEKDSYEGSIEENTANMEVMRFKAIDADLEYTDNWLAQYEIISGNEAGYFSIETDPKTNEGVLMLNKVRQSLCGL
uniref:Cadherin domain-containing protein n=1 Tax=Scleropages formosus TaxID=113540 RepID=A0A8C9RRR8_SCLFO